MIAITSNGGSRSWNIQFHRAPDDWEVDRIDAFYEHIYSKMPRGVGVDSFFWKLSPNGVFDVRSFYNSLSAPSTISFPWKCIWSSKVPRRVSFFLWTAARDSTLTIDNLVKRNLPLVNRCCLCRYDGETMDHLLPHCKFINALRSEVFFMFVIQWVMPRTIVSLLCAWENDLGIHSSSISNMVPACLMWLIWRERNTRTFEDVEKSVDLLESPLVGTLFGFLYLYLFQVQSVHHREHDVLFY